MTFCMLIPSIVAVAGGDWDATESHDFGLSWVRQEEFFTRQLTAGYAFTALFSLFLALVREFGEARRHTRVLGFGGENGFGAASAMQHACNTPSKSLVF
jgi:hypothetical protein